MSTDERIQALSSLLNSLIERLAGAVTTFAEDLVLRQEHTVNTAHQAATLAVEIGIDFLLESSLVEIAASDGYAKGEVGRGQRGEEVGGGWVGGVRNGDGYAILTRADRIAGLALGSVDN